jgi:cytoskeletal protein RodZ
MSEEKQPTIAEELSAARQARGLDLEEVQRQTGISLAVLQGIEAGQFDVVEPVFARLALKAYAELLGLDPEPLLTRFDQQHGQAFQPRHRPTVLLSQPVRRRSRKPLIVIGLVIGACCALAVAFYLFGGRVAPSQTPAQSSAPPQATAVPPQAVVAQPESQPTTAPNDPIVAQSSTADTSATVAAAQTTESAPVVLELEARDSTWVQIRWDDSAENFERIVPPGERHRFEARDHFVVLSTRPHGLRYWLDGQLLGNGQLGDPTNVLRFRATADGIELLGSNLQSLAEEAPDAQP